MKFEMEIIPYFGICIGFGYHDEYFFICFPFVTITFGRK